MGKLFLRPRGLGFCKDWRTFTGGAEAGSFVGVLDLKDEDGAWVGGGGACLEGTKGSRNEAAAAAWILVSARRSLYSWMDSLEGRWYSTVILD